MKSWVKLWTEIIRDPKIGSLTWAQRGIWVALLAMAGEVDDRDEDDGETGMLDSIANTAWRIRCDLQEFAEALGLFVERRMVEERDGVLFIVHYGKRQFAPPSATRGSWRDRQKKHRMSRVSHEMSRGVTPPDTESDTDTDPEETREDHLPPPAPPQGAEDDDGDVRQGQIAEVFQTWEEINPRKQATPLDVDRLNEFITEHGAPAVAAAIRAANEYGKPTLAYVRGVLKGNGRSPPAKNRGRPVASLESIERSLEKARARDGLR